MPSAKLCENKLFMEGNCRPKARYRMLLRLNKIGLCSPVGLNNPRHFCFVLFLCVCACLCSNKCTQSPRFFFSSSSSVDALNKPSNKYGIWVNCCRCIWEISCCRRSFTSTTYRPHTFVPSNRFLCECFVCFYCICSHIFRFHFNRVSPYVCAGT